MKSLIVADVEIPFVEVMHGPFAGLCRVNGNSITSKTVNDADILLIRSVTRICEDILRGNHTRFIGAVTSGYDHVDLEYLSSRAIKFVYDQVINITSERIHTDTIDVTEGWNMIGSLSYPVDVNTITSDPPGMVTSQFFIYAGYLSLMTFIDCIHVMNTIY